MKQNKYDEASFFENYSRMPRSTGGLESAGEWGTFRTLLPDLQGQRVLDLGCGFGWHCRYAREQGAVSVVGIDLSANMLERARAMTRDPKIEYLQLAIEDAAFGADEFDTVISSLAIHYVEDFASLCRQVYYCLSLAEPSCSRSSIPSSPRSPRRIGITVLKAGSSIGPLTTIISKDRGRLVSSIMKLRSTTVMSLPTLIR